MTATAMLATPAPPPGIPPAPGDPGGQDAGTLAVANAALRGGFVLLPRTLLHAPGLSRDAKLLYAVLLSYAWQRGSCFPGAERLQADLGCGKNQVTRYLQELEGAGLLSRRRRGQGKTTLYTLHDPPTPSAPAPARGQATQPVIPDSPKEGVQSPRTGEPRLPESGNQDAPKRGAEYDSGERKPAEHHPLVVQAPPPAAPRPTLAPATTLAQEITGAGDDDALQLLLAQGVTPRIAQELMQTHSAEAIRQQAAWQGHRPAAKSPAGALVQAIRDAWPPPPAWREAQAHAATMARQEAEEAARRAADEAQRRQWAAKPPEERIAGRLQFWVLQQRAKRHEPTPAEVAARRAELLAELAARTAARPAQPGGCPG